jgi:hypothetical protein
MAEAPASAEDAATIATVLPPVRRVRQAAPAEAPVDRSELAMVCVAVPIRTSAALKIGLDLHSTFLLTQVDGTSSIAEIAERTHMPVRDAMKLFVELRSKGVIELTTVSNVEAPPRSDVYMCPRESTTDSDDEAVPQCANASGPARRRSGAP